MGSIIFKTYKDIVNIKKRGNFKVEIIFKNRHEANRILKDETLKKFNLETFIPGFRKIRKGIIEGVPTNLSEEDILKLQCNNGTNMEAVTSPSKTYRKIRKKLT